MKNKIRKIASGMVVKLGYWVAFCLLLLSYLLTLYADKGIWNETKMVNHTHRVMINTEKLLSSLKDAESAFRGYIVVKDSAFLKPYYQSRAKTDSIFGVLKRETADNVEQQRRLDNLNQLIQKKYQIFNSSLSYYSTKNFQINDSLKIQAGFSHVIMLRINAIGKEIEDMEENLLKIRKDQVSSKYNILNNVVMASLLLAFLLVVYGFITYTKENKKRRLADKQVNHYQFQLEQQVNDLDAANKELIQMRGLEKFAVTGRIARTIAHEVRNPLTNINLATDQLKVDLNGEMAGETANMLNMIHRNSDRINQLITDLLESTKATELNTERVPVDNLLDETMELARDRIELAGIKIQKDYARDSRMIFVDKEKMKIAFLNIIVNAIESMHSANGMLVISTSSDKNKCIVKIKDNGSGIDKESLAKLFEPYFTSKPNGTGLGLTNTQNIIFLHNGQIRAESKPGIGTTFFVILNYF
jgi:signal transduction histidine kinase